VCSLSSDKATRRTVNDGAVVRDVWAGHFDLLKVRIQNSREAIAASLRQPGARPVTVAVWQVRNRGGGEAGKHYNAIGVIDADGKWLGTRRKNPLSPGPYDLESFTEPPPDQRCAVFRTRHATAGVSACFDGEFPESVRRMRLAGAELLLWCNAATGNVAVGHSNRVHHSGQLRPGEPDVGRVLQCGGQGVLRHERDCRPPG
jgi:predicted amidohydrolase